MAKSHKERTIGSLFLATGTASAIAGIIIADHSAGIDPDPKKLITIRGVALLGSIPIFPGGRIKQKKSEPVA